MLGDDASTVFAGLMEKIFEILKMMYDAKQSRDRDKTVNKPKIKSGAVSKRDFNRLLSEGVNFRYVTFPKEKLPELEEAVQSMGGAMFTTKTENGNNAVIAVPEQHLEIVNMAMQHIVADIMKDTPEALKVKNGEHKIDSEDIGIAADVLRKSDIPVYSFTTNDGKCMNIVPKEYEGQYEAAMNEVRAVSEQLKNIEVTRYEQTSPLDSLDVYAAKMTPEAIKSLNAAAKADSLDIKFAKYDGGEAAVYPAELADKVNKMLEKSAEDMEESEKWLIDIKDSTVIEMDREKLVKGEDESSYFVRVPNTAGLDYLRIDKGDVNVINNGKTLTMKIDPEKTYSIFDSSEKLKSERSGSELSSSYNTKDKRADKDTAVVKYGDGIERIELYNAEKNKLISLEIDKAEKIRAELIGEGISAGAVNNLLSDINENLPDNYKDNFMFTEEKAEVVYADIPNIGEYLAQSQLSQQLIGKAQCYGEIPKDNGSKFCVFDKSENKFAILPVMPRAEIAATLSQMGYSEISAKEIADKVALSYRDTDSVDISLDERKRIISEKFTSDNPELSDLGYYKTETGMLVMQDSGDKFRYMDIDSGSSASEVSKAIQENFDIKDERSAAEIMQQMAKDNIISPETVKVNEFAAAKLTENYIEVRSQDGKSALVHKDKMTDIGISANTASEITKGLFHIKEQKPKSLDEMISYAKKVVSKRKSDEKTEHSTLSAKRER